MKYSKIQLAINLTEITNFQSRAIITDYAFNYFVVFGSDFSMFY